MLYVLGVGFSTYLAPILLVISFFIAFPLIIIQIYRYGFKLISWKIALLHIVVVIAFGIVLYIVLIRPYLFISKIYPPPSFYETALYSSNLHSIFDGISIFSYWYTPSTGVGGAHEYTNFPGLSLLLPGVS